MEFLIVILLILLVVSFFMKYNKMQRLGNEVKRFRGDVTASMKKRADLVGRLIDVTKSYGDHEKLTQLTVSDNMTRMGGGGPANVENASQIFSGLAMAYPDLKANVTYQQLMSQLHDIEGNLQVRRETYNEAVSQYNGYRCSLPQVMFAGALGFPEAAFYSTDESGLDTLPDFKTDDGLILRESLQKMGERAGAIAQTAGQRLNAKPAPNEGDV
jgi:LemA protein